MAGHSKWANIKHRKGAQDAKRAKVFSRVAKNIIIAVQAGGADPETNYNLKTAVDAARKVNMPKDNIERAIKTASGNDNSARIEEITYEAMGPAGSSMIILCATDNTNRSLTEVKTALKKNGGKFASSGSVQFNYERVGHIEVPYEDHDACEIAIIESGAKDLEETEEDKFIVTTSVEDFHLVQDFLHKNSYETLNAELVYKPLQTIDLDEKSLKEFEVLYDAIDDVDDVQEIYTNLA